MNAGKQEERELIELAIWCARSGEATHWPTAAGWLLTEIENLRASLSAESRLLRLSEDREQVAWARVMQLNAKVADLGAELRRRPAVVVESDSLAHFKIHVVDPATANLINRAKAAHEVMLREQDETEQVNAAHAEVIDRLTRANHDQEVEQASETPVSSQDTNNA